MSIFKFWIKLIMPFRFEIGGGGDGGAQAEAERVRAEESQEEYQIAQDINAIRAMFGDVDVDYTDIGSPMWIDPRSGAATGVSESQDYYQQWVDYEGPQYRPNLYDDSGPIEISGYVAPERAQGYLDQISDILGDYDPTALSESASANRAAREASLEGVYSDVMNYYSSELDRQRNVEAAKSAAAIADRGLYGSTVESAIYDRLNEIYGTQLGALEGRAEDTRVGLRQSDVDLQNEMEQMILAGGDIQSAMDYGSGSRENTLSQLSQEAMGADLTNLFAGMDELYGQRQYVDAYNRGRQRGSSGVVTPGSGSTASGTIVNI